MIERSDDPGAELRRLYAHRFESVEGQRTDLWRVLCDDFFSRWVPPGSTVLDVAAGHCEFVNNIKAARRIADSGVPVGNSSGGKIAPSSKPSRRGARKGANTRPIGEVSRMRSSSCFIRRFNSGLGATAQKSDHAART